MKITRNGQEFELTYLELMAAHTEYEHRSTIEDIDARYDEYERGVGLTSDDMREIAERVINNLGHCDRYFETYWDVVDQTIDEYLEGKE